MVDIATQEREREKGGGKETERERELASCESKLVWNENCVTGWWWSDVLHVL